MKLKKKVRIGSKIIKRYDRPKTPYARILGAKDVSGDIKKNLRDIYSGISLVSLKRELDLVLLKLEPTKVG